MSLRFAPFSWSAAAAVALAMAAPGGARGTAAEPAFRSVSLQALRGRIESPGTLSFTPRGLEIQVDGNTPLALPFAAQALEADVEADGPVMLTWAARVKGEQSHPFGTSWRHVTLPRKVRRVALDLRIADGWTPIAQPVLVLTGSGRVVFHALRALPVPSDPAELRAAFDRAMLWAPESFGQTTINLLNPSFWSASRGIWLSDVVAGAAGLALVGALAAMRLRGRRPRPGLALAAGALVALGAWNIHFFLVRFLPMLNLHPTFDAEERIRNNYYVSPDVGALAALARSALRSDERVGAIGPSNGWFAAQTICFNLAPRRCVILKPGEREHVGISGVGRLRDDEIDAIVAYRAGPLPDGFVPVAALGPSAVVARRR